MEFNPSGPNFHESNFFNPDPPNFHQTESTFNSDESNFHQTESTFNFDESNFNHTESTFNFDESNFNHTESTFNFDESNFFNPSDTNPNNSNHSESNGCAFPDLPSSSDFKSHELDFIPSESPTTTPSSFDQQKINAIRQEKFTLQADSSKKSFSYTLDHSLRKKSFQEQKTSTIAQQNLGLQNLNTSASSDDSLFAKSDGLRSGNNSQKKPIEVEENKKKDDFDFEKPQVFTLKANLCFQYEIFCDKLFDLVSQQAIKATAARRIAKIRYKRDMKALNLLRKETEENNKSGSISLKCKNFLEKRFMKFLKNLEKGVLILKKNETENKSSVKKPTHNQHESFYNKLKTNFLNGKVLTRKDFLDQAYEHRKTYSNENVETDVNTAFDDLFLHLFTIYQQKKATLSQLKKSISEDMEVCKNLMNEGVLSEDKEGLKQKSEAAKNFIHCFYYERLLDHFFWNEHSLDETVAFVNARFHFHKRDEKNSLSNQAYKHCLLSMESIIKENKRKKSLNNSAGKVNDDAQPPTIKAKRPVDCVKLTIEFLKKAYKNGLMTRNMAISGAKWELNNYTQSFKCNEIPCHSFENLINSSFESPEF